MGLLRDMLTANRYRRATALVPTEVAVRDPQGRFGFEMPWPWFEVEPELGGQASPGEAIVIAAPRTSDPWPTGSIGAVTEKSSIDDATVRADVQAFARSVGGRSRRPRRLVVGGVPAVDFGAETAAATLHRIVIPEGELTVTVEFHLPARTAEGYEVHIESMLASWYWR